MESQNLYANWPYLFLAYGIALGILAGFAGRLAAKQSRLEERLRDLEGGED